MQRTTGVRGNIMRVPIKHGPEEDASCTELLRTTEGSDRAAQRLVRVQRGLVRGLDR